MKILYLFVVLLFGFQAYVIKREPQIAIEKKEFSDQEGVGLTAEDFERGDKLILEPPDKNAPFPFEFGDIINPDDNAILNKRTSKRASALKKESRLWPNKTVPYLITTGFYQNETALIARAISEFRRNTCVNWTARNGETDYIFFGKSGSCGSYVGRVGGCQLIMLRPNRCFHFITLLHEMMHALGFEHEHQRSDRDQYIYINTSNLILTKEVEDNLISLTPGATPIGEYDFFSVLHYDIRDYSKNRYPTIVPVEIENFIEKRRGLSDGDIAGINQVYKCNE